MFTNCNRRYIYERTDNNESREIERRYYWKYYWIVSWFYLKLGKKGRKEKAAYNNIISARH